MWLASEVIMDIQNTGQVDPYSRFRMERTDNRASVNSVSGSSTQTSQAAAIGQKADSVTLSNEGVLRTEAYRVAMNGSPVRQDKVGAIKEQVQNGTDTVDSKRIASKMLGEELDMFG